MNTIKKAGSATGSIFITVLKWILIIVFFPLSLIFVAYYKQRKADKEYYRKREEYRARNA